MKALETIPHPNMLISILYMNQKFILKFEAGPYEQIYKFTKEMAPDIDAVKSICTDDFMAEVQAGFDRMHDSFKKRFF